MGDGLGMDRGGCDGVIVCVAWTGDCDRDCADVLSVLSVKNDSNTGKNSWENLPLPPFASSVGTLSPCCSLLASKCRSKDLTHMLRSSLLHNFF